MKITNLDQTVDETVKDVLSRCFTSGMPDFSSPGVKPGEEYLDALRSAHLFYEFVADKNEFSRESGMTRYATFPLSEALLNQRSMAGVKVTGDHDSKLQDGIGYLVSLAGLDIFKHPKSEAEKIVHEFSQIGKIYDGNNKPVDLFQNEQNEIFGLGGTYSALYFGGIRKQVE